MIGTQAGLKQGDTTIIFSNDDDKRLTFIESFSKGEYIGQF